MNQRNKNNNNKKARSDPKSVKTDGIVPLCQDAKKGLERLRRSCLTWPKLADKLGRSISLIQLWRTGSSKINRADAINLALLDVAYSQDPTERVKHWLRICNHETDDNKIEEEVSRRTSLQTRISDSLAKLIDLAATKGLSSSDFTMALSCHLGQKRMEQEIDAWLAGTNGQGTTGIFWRLNDVRADRLLHQQSISFIKKMISPDQQLRNGWSPKGNPSNLGVSLFLQINDDEGEQTGVEEALRNIMVRFRNELELNSSDKERLQIYFTKKKISHPADVFVFISPVNSLGVLVSNSNKLMRKVLTSTAQEMKSRPWDWCCQVIQVDGEEVVKRDCLKSKEVVLNTDYARLEPDSHTWTPMKFK